MAKDWARKDRKNSGANGGTWGIQPRVKELPPAKRDRCLHSFDYVASTVMEFVKCDNFYTVNPFSKQFKGFEFGLILFQCG